MGEELKVIFLTNLKNCPAFIQYYPSKGNQEHRNHLISISNSIKTYGNGILQNKNEVYYYRTFTYEGSSQTLFCIIYYNLPYKRIYAENLVEEIYELTYNQNIFIHNEFDTKISKQINKLFYRYASIPKNEKKYKNIKDSNNSNIINRSINSNYSNYSNCSLRKQIYSRVDNKQNKEKNDLDNIFSNAPNATELDFILKGKKLYNLIKISKWKKSKKRWLWVFIIISVVLYVLLGLYIYFYIELQNKDNI